MNDIRRQMYETSDQGGDSLMSGGSPADLLSQLPLFEGAEMGDLMLLAHQGTQAQFRSGEAITTAGEFLPGAVLIVSGQARLSQPPDQTLLLPPLAGVGTLLGETALFTRTQAAVSAEAVTMTLVLILPHAKVREVLENRPGLAERLQERIEQRLELARDDILSMHAELERLAQ